MFMRIRSIGVFHVLFSIRYSLLYISWDILIDRKFDFHILFDNTRFCNDSTMFIS